MFHRQTPNQGRVTFAGRSGWRRLSAAVAILAATALTTPGVYASQHMARVTGEGEISVEEVQKEISAAFSAISAYTADQRDEALKKARATMDKVDAEIEVLEQRARNNWAEMSTQARKNSDETLKALRDSRNELAESYGALAQGTSNAWDDLKMGFSNAWTRLKNAWDAAVEDSNANVPGGDEETMPETESGAEAMDGGSNGSEAQ